MPTLPTVGADYDSWGTELNDWLAAGGIVHHLQDGYGATGDGTTDDTAAINAALAAMGSGHILFVPPGTYKTNGSHEVPAGSIIMGASPYTSTFLNRGATYCFQLKDESSPSFTGTISNISIEGSTGALAAVAGGIGIEISNGQGARLNNVVIYGFTSSGVGLQFRNANGTTEYVEQTLMLGCQIVNCTTCIKFTCDTGAGTSFGYTNMVGLQLQVYASQTAINVGGTGITMVTGLYNSRISGALHYTGNSGIGLDVTASGLVWQGMQWDIRGEVLSGTSLTRIRNNGIMSARGTFYITPIADVPDDIGGAITHEFREEALSFAETDNDYDIASAATLVIPAYSMFWNVTGTTSVTAIGGYSGGEGVVVVLRFADALTFTDGGNLKLAGDFVTTADDTITLAYRSGTWYEVSRSAN
jgi:hypothetical protein